MADYKVVDSAQLDADLKVVADAIRSKGGTTEQLSFPQGMKQAVEAIQSGNGGITPTGTIEITENGTHDVTNYASANVNVQSGGGSGVDYLAKRINVNDEFYSYYSEKITKMKQHSFSYDSELIKLDLPNCTNISGSICYNALNLEEINFPNLIYITQTNHFQNTKIKEATFPKLLNNSPCPYFGGSANLKKVIIGGAGKILSTSFINCKVFDTFIIRRADGVPSLENINAFNGTPIANGTGFIYVPKAIIDTYKTATNWTTYANQFRALEDYTVDGTITGELDESKI